MSKIDDLIEGNDRYITATVTAYKHRLEELLATAQAQTLATLARKLDLAPDGSVNPTAANQRIIRSIDTLLLQELDAAGLPALNNAFVSQFAGQLPALDDILDQLGARMKAELPSLKEAIRADEMRALASQQINTTDNLQAAFEAAANSVKRQALLGVSGLGFSDLAGIIQKAMGNSAAQAAGLADTAMTVFFRTTAARAFEFVQAEMPAMILKYKYSGPVDSKIRPFCLSHVGKVYSRDQIDKMDNEQLPDVFTTCGGYLCRHMFILWVA